jgi:hypothetical protein
MPTVSAERAGIKPGAFGDEKKSHAVFGRGFRLDMGIPGL